LAGASAFVAVDARAYENIGVASFVRNEVNGVLPTRTVQINIGENVVRDEIVKTSPDSVAKLVFTDSSNLSIGPNSVVKLDQFVAAGASSYGKSTINVLKGAFRFTTGHFDKRAYEVKTGVATIGVRGTIYEGRAEPNRTILNVLEGAVRVRTSGGGGCNLSAGQSAVITASNCSPAAGFAPNSHIFAEQCAKSPALCSKEEYSQLQPTDGSEQGFTGGDYAGMILMPAAGIGGGIGAWLGSRPHSGNSGWPIDPPASP
jgi:quercetin dioxygenase-like cupin family protein